MSTILNNSPCNSFVVKGDKACLFLTQNQKTFIDRLDLEKALQHRWYAFRHRDRYTFYAATKVSGRNLQLHRFFCPDFKEVDHIDRDGLNNCRSNLREGYKINAQNRRLSRNNSSGFKGVYWHKRDQNWGAYISYKDKDYSLGYFSSRKQAARAYDTAVKRLFPPGCYLNFPNQ